MHKLQDRFPQVCKAMETVLAILVMIAMLLYAFHLVFQTNLISGLLTGETDFSTVLENVFGLVIGIEFIEMLCRPDSQAVLEVLIFLTARHIIIGNPTPIEMVILVIAVCVLCIVRRGLFILKMKTVDLEDRFREHENGKAAGKEN